MSRGSFMKLIHSGAAASVGPRRCSAFDVPDSRRISLSPPAAPDRPTLAPRPTFRPIWRRGHGGQARRLGGEGAISPSQPAGREFRLRQAQRAAGGLQHPGIGHLVLIERIRQRHQDRRPPDRGKLGDRRGAGAGDHEMGRRHARRQIGEERRHLGGDLQVGIGRFHLRPDPPRAPAARSAGATISAGSSCLNRGWHDVGHHARALAAAEDQQAQRPARFGRRIGRRRRPGSPPAAPDCRPRWSWRRVSSSGSDKLRKPVAMAVTRPARKRLARPITAFCSWMMVGMPRSEAASSGGTVG